MRFWVLVLLFALIASCGEGNLDFPGAGEDDAALTGTETPGTQTPGTETPTPEETPQETPTPGPTPTTGTVFPPFQCQEQLEECSLFQPCCEGLQCVPGLIPVPGAQDVPSFCLPIPAPPM